MSAQTVVSRRGIGFIALLRHTSLFHGWFPFVVTATAWLALLVGIAWTRRAYWHWVAIGAGAFLVVALINWLFDVPARVRSTYPASFLVITALPVFALGAAAWQWPVVKWWRRAIALVAVPALAAYGALRINDHYAYLPTLGDVFGAPLHGEVAASRLLTPTADASSQGLDAKIDIPAPQSHFPHRASYVWLPPAYFRRPRPHLPVLMLIAGVPGTTSDWIRSAGAAEIADAWAKSHGGFAPAMVFPDANGSAFSDTECVNGSRGQAATYLVRDVRTFMRQHFGVSTNPRAWAVGGLSEGGTCALTLATENPHAFSTFADFSGDAAPTLGSTVVTIDKLFGGSWSEYAANNPERWFPTDVKAGLAGAFVVGANDHKYLAIESRVVQDARAAHMDVVFDTLGGGGHNFRTWEHALRDIYPWLMQRLFTRTTHNVRHVSTHHGQTVRDTDTRGAHRIPSGRAEHRPR